MLALLLHLALYNGKKSSEDADLTVRIATGKG